MDEFGEYLASCKALEVEGETYASAIERCKEAGKAVYWNGHRMSVVRGEVILYAYNN